MAWTAPRTFVTGEIETAAIFNTHLRDNLKYLKGQAGTVAIEDAITINSVLALNGVSAAQSTIRHTAASGAGLLDIDVLASDGSSAATVRVGRSTNTSGAVALQMFKGNNTGTVNAQIAGSGSSYVCADNGNFGVGTNSPQAILHTYKAISGFIKYEFDGVDGTARTVVPDGAGDVLYGVMPIWAVRASDGNTQGGAYSTGGTALLAPGGTLNIYSAGGNILQLQVSAGGAVTVQRTGGSLTYKVSLLMHWL